MISVVLLPMKNFLAEVTLIATSSLFHWGVVSAWGSLSTTRYIVGQKVGAENLVTPSQYRMVASVSAGSRVAWRNMPRFAALWQIIESILAHSCLNPQIPLPIKSY